MPQIGGMSARSLDLKGPETYVLGPWTRTGHAGRLKTLRRIVMEYGRDPRVATKVVQILREAKVEPRQFKSQAAALLKWVQEHIYYVNEPDERLQSPEYTLRVGYGDCDDMAILLGAFYESIGLPWRFVISGFDKEGRPVRWVESKTPVPKAHWAHIYVKVGWPPGRPQAWDTAEPTIKGVPLGWDVVDALRRGERIPLPELQPGGNLAGVAPGVLGLVEVAAPTYGLVPVGSPVAGVGSLVPVPTAISDLKDELQEELHWKKIAVTAIVGAVTSVATGLLVTYLRPQVMRIAKRKKKGTRRR